MTVEEWTKKLREEQFGEVWEHTDKADFSYPIHSHPVNTTYVVFEGSMVVPFEGKDHEMRPGDRLDIAKHVEHSTKIGPEGCTFLIGVRV